MDSPSRARGRWLALAAALLGWLFDGFEMGLFPVIARPALIDLLDLHPDPATKKLTKAEDSLVSRWNGLAIAGFLVGAATGGVLFGWLGDRIGRVRAMSLSILTYAICSGVGAFTAYPWQIVAVRFVAALGMGGEWSLGVALVMELWGGRSRGLLAGVIGAVGNFGYTLVALVSMRLEAVRETLGHFVSALGVTDDWTDRLTANAGWRLLMMAGTLPALLTFFIRMFVPESEKWREEKTSGRTSSWATRDLLGVLIGAGACGIMLFLWSQEVNWGLRLAGTAAALAVVTAGYLYPVRRYLRRSGTSTDSARQTVRRMLIGASLSGVALMGTWGSVLWATNWADELSGGRPGAKQWTMFCSAWGAVFSSLLAPLVGDWLGRRVTYCWMCIGAMAFTWLFYLGNTSYGPWFLATVFLAGASTATFYGWLPLYLPELFPTAVRATGQGFSYNFGRILAAIAALQTGALTGLFQKAGGLPTACSVMCLVYLAGLALIWLAPETKGKPLAD